MAMNKAGYFFTREHVSVGYFNPFFTKGPSRRIFSLLKRVLIIYLL